MGNQEANIKEGTISFWIEAGRIQFNDGVKTSIIEFKPLDGSISLVKDSDNKLRFSHVYLRKGDGINDDNIECTDVKYDVTSLDPNKRHMIAVTWNLKNGEIIMYIDGKEVAKTEIEYKV